MPNYLSRSIVILLVLLTFPIQTAVAQFRTVALSDGLAPGTGQTFSDFGRPVINGHGLVAFYAEIDSSSNYGIWSEGTGLLGNVMLGGTAAPGTSLNFDGVDRIIFNDLGHTLFAASLDSFPNESNGIWTDRTGTLSSVVATGQSVPGSSQVFRFSTHVDANSSGQTAFVASTGPVLASGIYSEGTGSLDAVVETNTSSFTSFSIPVINDSGHVAFKAEIPGAFGIYSNRTGSLAAVAVQGESAPGGGTLSTLFRGDVVINNAGDIAFKNLLTGAIHNGLFVAEAGGTLREIARTGDSVPGTSTTFTDNSLILASVFLDGTGDAIVYAEQLANGSKGIFRETSSGLESIVKTGDAAPGTGFLFDNIVGFSASENGHVAILGQFDNANFDDGIWLFDGNSLLTNIVKAGDMIEVSAGDFREVEFLSLLTISNGFGYDGAVNNFGQVAFRASFLDGSTGIFVSPPLAIPEPQVLILLVSLVPGLVTRRSKRRTG